MPAKPLVVLGMLGANLDKGRTAARWEHWRPSVALCQHEDLLIRRGELTSIDPAGQGGDLILGQFCRQTEVECLERTDPALVDHGITRCFTRLMAHFQSGDAVT